MDLPAEMTEITITRPGGPEVLQARRVPVPKPQAGELLIRVMAAGVNRPDVLQRMGKYPLPPDAQPTPGLEIAGQVVGLGEGLETRAKGDLLCGLTNGGGYAEYCRVPAGQLNPWPEGFNAVQAAAIPETYFTVWANLFQMGRASIGQTVLIHGGTSGIGTTAIQLCHDIGMRTLATAGTAEKCAAMVKLGCDVAINYREQDFAEVVQRETEGRGVNAILDMVGAAYLERNMVSLAMDGKLLLIGFQGGAVAERFDLTKILGRRLIITGSAMRPRTAREKSEIASELYSRVWPRLGPGKIEPVIHATFPLEQAAIAHRLMEAGEHIGKIVLEVTGGNGT